jgi:hypothetical protein
MVVAFTLLVSTLIWRTDRYERHRGSEARADAERLAAWPPRTRLCDIGGGAESARAMQVAELASALAVPDDEVADVALAVLRRQLGADGFVATVVSSGRTSI